MHKKIFIIFLIIVFLCLGGFLFYKLTKIEDPIVEDAGVSTPTTVIQETTEVTESTESSASTSRPGRELSSSNITVQIDERSEDDLVYDSDDIDSIPMGSYQYRDTFGTAGILIEESDKVYVEQLGFGSSISCKSKLDMDSNVDITIVELSNDKTKEQYADEKLDELWFKNYLEYRINGINIDDTNVEVGVGYKEPSYLFGDSVIRDYTVKSNKQIIYDTEVDTALGMAKYLIVYFSDMKQFKGYIYLDNSDRILEIDISADDEETIYYYLIELTNKNIHFTKGD